QAATASPVMLCQEAVEQLMDDVYGGHRC
ncbi:MAG: hypothetical protein ACI9BK_001953, partial [Acidimicrobiales bacterium]